VVEDNGRGIPEAVVQSPRSLGVMGLRERVQAFGGRIDFKGQEGRGTSVSVAIPMTVAPPVFHA
jgi:signal transduction histidine kinase